MLPDRAGGLSWIARLFLQRPIVVKLSQATEWDNDVPPYPVLAGEVARAERRGIAAMNAVAISRDNIGLALFDPPLVLAEANVVVGLHRRASWNTIEPVRDAPLAPSRLTR
jgi:hypothetical protein